MRMCSNERPSRDRSLTPRPDRLPEVSHYSNKYDFKLFQEAQALAAELAVSLVYMITIQSKRYLLKGN